MPRQLFGTRLPTPLEPHQLFGTRLTTPLDPSNLFGTVLMTLPSPARRSQHRLGVRTWRFLLDPIIPLDNNAAERSLRGPVIGRKVHYGSKSKRGTEIAAIFYTIFETAKLNCRDPVAYLREAVRQLHQGGAPLMPWDYQAELDAAAIKTG